jgi:predicted glycoside hydrolase/deacetylase ChbG (UPF0249 family)
MTEHHRDVEFPALTPAMANLAREFRAALRQARELETEKLRFSLSQLELFRDEMAAWNADLCAALDDLRRH